MSKPKPTPSKEMLTSLLDYNPETGALHWKARDLGAFQDGGHSAGHNLAKWNAKFAGKPAFTAVKSDGYKHTNLGGQWVTAHRVIWKMVYGEEADRIDHINGDRADNRLANLRSVPTRLNAKNMARHKNATSPSNGVRKTKSGKRWQAFLYADGKFVSLGCHATPEEAAAARKAGQVAFDYHENHGRTAIIKD